jgi:hypothetical protein
MCPESKHPGAQTVGPSDASIDLTTVCKHVRSSRNGKSKRLFGAIAVETTIIAPRTQQFAPPRISFQAEESSASSR